MRRFQQVAAVFLFALTIQCGTQTGNPATINVLEDSNLFSTALNSVYDAVVSSSRAGHYAYSNDSGAIAMTRTCEGVEPGAVKIAGSGESSHSITEDRSQTLSQSALVISRTETDIWQADDAACDANSLRLGDSAWTLTSTLSGDRERDLAMTVKADNSQVTHNSTMTASGTRTLSVQQQGAQVSLGVALDLRRTIKTADINGSQQTFDMSVVMSSPASVVAAVDESGAVSSYTINATGLTVSLPQAKTITFEMSNVTVTRDGGCFPTSGTMTGTISSGGDVTIDFSEGETAKFNSATLAMLFVPQGCEFNER